MPARPLAIAVAAVASLLITTPALAQGSGVLLPGQVERQFKSLPQPRDAGALPPVPGTSEAGPEQADAIRFTLRDIAVEGAQQLPPETVEALTAPLLGREISLSDLYRLAARLSARYREAGFLLSQVIVPAQTVDDGRARLQAVEGFIDTVHLEGGTADERDLITRYAMKIRNTRPLTQAALERYMLLINDLPGIFAYATLAPSKDRFAAADLHIHLSERRFDAGLTVDNRGGRTLGTTRLIADLAAANVLGLHENTALKAVASPGGELAFVSLRHDQQIGSEGGRLSLSLSTSRAEPDDQSFIPLDLETRSNGLEVGYSHPLIRSRSRNLYVRASLAGHDGEERVFGNRDREDHVRSVRLAMTYDFVDRGGATSIIDFEASQGLNALGASDNGDPLLTRSGGRVDYRKLNLFAARLQDIGRRWSLLTALSAQYAFDELLSSELYAFGGEPFGRGYDPSELVGDHGAAAKVELRYAGQWGLAVPVPYQIYGFYDIGRVWSRTDDTPGGDPSAASLGLGTRLSFGRHFNGFIELARPLTRPIAAEQDKSTRFYAGFSARM